MSQFSQKMLTKHAVHGGLYTVASQAMSGFSYTANLRLRKGLGGMSIPLPVAFFALGVMNSVMSDLAHTLIKEEIPAVAKFEDEASLAFSALYAGLMAPALAYVASPNLFRQVGPLKLAMIGAGSEVVSSFAQTML